MTPQPPNAPRRTPPARKTPARRRTPPGATGTSGSDTRVEILKAAAGAFKRLGYHGATLEEIAAVLKMKKGNLYYYFRSKEEILFACHQYSMDRLLDVLHTVEQEDLPPEQKLRHLIVAFVHTILDDLHGTALFLDIKALGARRLKQAIARRDEFDRGVRQVIQQGVDWGDFDPKVDPKLLSFAMMGAVNWIPRWYSADGPSTSKDIADRFADYLIAGLRAREPL
ncbi:MAG: TetR/AcrR family transcriptional regulator [Vicinamibacterales bacterium]